MHAHSPNDEFKLWTCQHENTQQRGDRSVKHRGKHAVQGRCSTLVSVSGSYQEALRWGEGGEGAKWVWSYKTCVHDEDSHDWKHLQLEFYGLRHLHTVCWSVTLISLNNISVINVRRPESLHCDKRWLTIAIWTVNSTPMPTAAMRMTTGMALNLMLIKPMMPNNSTVIVAKINT